MSLERISPQKVLQRNCPMALLLEFFPLTLPGCPTQVFGPGSSPGHIQFPASEDVSFMSCCLVHIRFSDIKEAALVPRWGYRKDIRYLRVRFCLVLEATQQIKWRLNGTEFGFTRTKSTQSTRRFDIVTEYNEDLSNFLKCRRGQMSTYLCRGTIETR